MDGSRLTMRTSPHTLLDGAAQAPENTTAYNPASAQAPADASAYGAGSEPVTAPQDGLRPIAGLDFDTDRNPRKAKPKKGAVVELFEWIEMLAVALCHRGARVFLLCAASYPSTARR